MKRGFTLLELIVVMIIIGILATLGLTQYGRAVERGRGAEAKQILGMLRTEAAAHYLQYNSLTAPAFDTTRAGIGVADDQIPSACRASHYFSYGIATTATTLTATATRCDATGRGGLSPASGRTLTLVTTYPAGTDVWGGTGGY